MSQLDPGSSEGQSSRKQAVLSAAREGRRGSNQAGGLPGACPRGRMPASGPSEREVISQASVPSSSKTLPTSPTSSSAVSSSQPTASPSSRSPGARCPCSRVPAFARSFTPVSHRLSPRRQRRSAPPHRPPRGAASPCITVGCGLTPMKLPPVNSQIALLRRRSRSLPRHPQNNPLESLKRPFGLFATRKSSRSRLAGRVHDVHQLVACSVRMTRGGR